MGDEICNERREGMMREWAPDGFSFSKSYIRYVHMLFGSWRLEGGYLPALAERWQGYTMLALFFLLIIMCVLCGDGRG